MAKLKVGWLEENHPNILDFWLFRLWWTYQAIARQHDLSSATILGPRYDVALTILCQPTHSPFMQCSYLPGLNIPSSCLQVNQWRWLTNVISANQLKLKVGRILQVGISSQCLQSCVLFKENSKKSWLQSPNHRVGHVDHMINILLPNRNLATFVFWPLLLSLASTWTASGHSQYWSLTLNIESFWSDLPFLGCPLHAAAS